jgi:hypothetical protein
MEMVSPSNDGSDIISYKNALIDIVNWLYLGSLASKTKIEPMISYLTA